MRPLPFRSALCRSTTEGSTPLFRSCLPRMRTVVEDLVRRFYAQLWNRWDDVAVNDVIAGDFSFRGSLGRETRGRAGWREYRDMIRAASPDFHNEIVDVVAAGDRAAARLLYSGTHAGEL